MPSKPMSWEKYENLLVSEDFERVLQTRLVELAFDSNASVAVKAVDLLLGLPKPEPDDILVGVSDDELKEARQRADNWLSRIRDGQEDASTMRIISTELYKRKIDKSLARRDFLTFCEYILGDQWITAPHHQMIADYLMGVQNGDIKRLMVNMPPRHGKSFMISILYVVFWLATHPDKKIIHISYASSLSNQFSRQSRAIIRDNPRFRELFPNVSLSTDRKAIDDWRLNTGGGLKSIGTGGGVTGHGADLMIIDDPHKEGDEHSPSTLEQAYDWFVSAARTRLHPGAPVIMVYTRWHPQDMGGRLLYEMAKDPNADQWIQLVLPALALENDLLGREVGEALWEDRVSKQDLLAIQALSKRYFEALFQQNPQISESPMFLNVDFKRGNLFDYANHLETKKIWSFDLASTEKNRSDYNIFGRWSLTEDRESLMLCEVIRFRSEWVGVRKKLIEIVGHYVDDDFAFAKQNLETLALQEVIAEFPERKSQFHEVSLPADKVTRANVFSAWVALGKVVVIDGDEGDYFVREHVLFPDSGQHDDCVDMSSVITHHFGLSSMFDFVMSEVDDSLEIDLLDVLSSVGGSS